MIQHTNVDFDIDAVIAWVDGNDFFHQEKMKPYLSNDQKISNKIFRTRFDQVEEIEYAIKSILKFAPYIRKIFLVTDNQTPEFLKNKKSNIEFGKVVIIDHKEIFLGYEMYLPTFNCLPIETMLTNIPDLAEHFVYFNDDLFLIKETKPDTFFINKFPVLRGKWRLYDENIWYKKAKNILYRLFGKKGNENKYGFKKGQQTIAKKLGFKKYFKFDHTPAPLRKSTLENYFSENPEMRVLNARHRFRNHEQYTLQGLANHLEIQNKTCVIKNDYQLGYLQSYKKPLLWYKLKLKYFEKDTNTLFLCLQSLDQCPKHKLNYILNWLKKFN